MQIIDQSIVTETRRTGRMSDGSDHKTETVTSYLYVVQDDDGQQYRHQYAEPLDLTTQGGHDCLYCDTVAARRPQPIEITPSDKAVAEAAKQIQTMPPVIVRA